MTISIEDSSDAELSWDGGMMLQWTIDTHHKEDHEEQSLPCFYSFIIIFYSRVNINLRVIPDVSLYSRSYVPGFLYCNGSSIFVIVVA